MVLQTPSLGFSRTIKTNHYARRNYLKRQKINRGQQRDGQIDKKKNTPNAFYGMH